MTDFISYAQNFEDLMLWRCLKDVKDGFYIDVGACDPFFTSVTHAFYTRGWHGINIEPSPTLMKAFKDKRERDINLECAAGKEPSTSKFYDCSVLGWSSMTDQCKTDFKQSKTAFKEVDVNVRTLAEICEEHCPNRDIHFLKVDVEGFENDVIEGMDFSKFRPWIVLVESINPRSNTPSYAEWEPKLLENNYTFAYKDGLNRFYVANEHTHLKDTFEFPPNIFDSFILHREISTQEALHAANKKITALLGNQTQAGLVDKLKAKIQLLMLKRIEPLLHKHLARIVHVLRKHPRLRLFLFRCIGLFPNLETKLRHYLKHKTMQSFATIPSHGNASKELPKAIQTVKDNQAKIKPIPKEVKTCEAKKKRIFWFGMHKILVKTELPRLRALGYEVFYPPYLSDVFDPSVQLEWDATQESSLPKEIFDKLAATNFFFVDKLDNTIASLLNEYFDAIIVTISPIWLSTILHNYKGPVLYRVYGQVLPLTEELERYNLKPLITQHPDFHFLPHAAEAVEHEASWLRKRERVVPYCISDDVFGYMDSWAGLEDNTGEVAMSCPSISNPFYAQHYEYLKKHFNEDYYKYYGVQSDKMDDPAVVGTLQRNEQLEALRNSACYVYTYDDPTICFLPPIESMVMGLPVLFRQGSLLEKYFSKLSTPACFKTEEEARTLIKRILDKDEALVENIIQPQHEVRKRYQPAFVWEAFDKTIKEILG